MAENQLVDNGKNSRKEDASYDIGGPVHVGEDAANGDKNDSGNHQDIDDDAEFFVAKITGKSHDGDKENSGGKHSVGGWEARFTGAIGADVDNPDFFENDKSNEHQGERDKGPAKFWVDFAERFASEPLIEKENAKEAEADESETYEDIGDSEPSVDSSWVGKKIRHKIIIA